MTTEQLRELRTLGTVGNEAADFIEFVQQSSVIDDYVTVVTQSNAWNEELKAKPAKIYSEPDMKKMDSEKQKDIMLINDKQFERAMKVVLEKVKIAEIIKQLRDMMTPDQYKESETKVKDSFQLTLKNKNSLTKLNGSTA